MKRVFFFLALLAGCILTCVVESQAQAQKKKKAEKVKVQFEGSNQEYVSKRERGQINLAIKTGAISYFYGSQALYVEKQLTNAFSVQAGAGVAFKDLSGWHKMLYGLDRANDPGDLSYSLGRVFSASMRYYFYREGFEQLYISPGFDYKYQPVTYITGTVVPNVPLQNQLTIGSLCVGWQYIADSNFVYDVGFGPGYLTGYYEAAAEDAAGTTSVKRYNLHRVTIQAYIRIGYRF